MQWHTANLVLALNATRAIFGRILRPKLAAMQPAVPPAATYADSIAMLGQTRSSRAFKA